MIPIATIVGRTETRAGTPSQTACSQPWRLRRKTCAPQKRESAGWGREHLGVALLRYTEAGVFARCQRKPNLKTFGLTSRPI
jgi:hypothetical protein